MAEITQLLESISQTFQSHPELDQLIQTLNQFVVGFGKATQRGLSAASPIMKGLGRGNMIHNIPQGLDRTLLIYNIQKVPKTSRGSSGN